MGEWWIMVSMFTFFLLYSVSQKPKCASQSHKKKKTHTQTTLLHIHTCKWQSNRCPLIFYVRVWYEAMISNFLNSSQIRNDIVIKSLIQTTGSSDYLNKSNGRCDLTFIQFPSYDLSFNLQLDPIYFLTCRNGKKKVILEDWSLEWSISDHCYLW